MLILSNHNSKFPLGDVVATRGVSDRIAIDPKFSLFVTKSFSRHCKGDWGDLDAYDKRMNEDALYSGDDRLFSRYAYDGDTSIYIITEWDRSATTILFPEEY